MNGEVQERQLTMTAPSPTRVSRQVAVVPDTFAHDHDGVRMRSGVAGVCVKCGAPGAGVSRMYCAVDPALVLPDGSIATTVSLYVPSGFPVRSAVYGDEQTMD